MSDSQRMRQAEAEQISFSRRLSALLISKAAPVGLNLVYSPLCIHSILTFLAISTTGPTQQQLRRFLRVPPPCLVCPVGTDFVLRDGYASGGPSLCYVSGVWVDSSTNVSELATQLANNTFKIIALTLPLRYMPEECRNEINSWVEQATSGLMSILFLPGSITGDPRMVLGNAIHFKGKWNEHFRPWSRNSEFHLLDGTTVETLFIVSEQTTQFISVYDGFKVVKIPYEHGSDHWRKFSFYIFLPDALDGLHDLWMKLDAQADFLHNHIPQTRVPVRNFRIPKFNISMAFQFAQYLKELDQLDLPFKMTGDFGMMVDATDSSDYYVSEIAHACTVEVNEEGTEPSAAYLAEMRAGSMMLVGQPVDFVADHPFVFLIREEATGVVFFAGHLLNPLL